MTFGSAWAGPPRGTVWVVLAAEGDAYREVAAALRSTLERLAPDATLRGIRPVSWFDSKEPLRSGWAWGQHYLEGGTAAVEAAVGKGKVFLLGPEITFRAQPHGTFKFLFNGIYYGTAE